MANHFILAPLILAITLVIAPAFPERASLAPPILIREIKPAPVATSYYRSELYFGRSIPGGGEISDADWEKFLADVVTPRFPDGFTLLDATGQYREQNGTIDKEPSEILIFLYPANKRTSSSRKIEEIRRAYIKRFKQESVLRLDFRSSVNVRF